MLSRNISLQKILETLEKGLETDEKRKPGTMELVKAFGNEVIKVVVADAENNWVVVTVLNFTR